MKKVLVVATSRYTRGGITAVLKLYEKSEMWKQYHCRWIGTHRDGGCLRKILFFLTGFVEYIVLLPFYDIVHIHFSLPRSAQRKYLFFRIAKIMQKKTVIHLHCGSQIDSIWNRTYQTMFEQCDCALLLSECLKNRIEKYTGKSKKYKVLYNPCPRIDSLCVYEKKNFILFSGTLYEGKGYKDLIRAFAKVTNSHPDWKLVFAGNGEEKKALELASDLGITERVLVMGWVNGEAKHKVFTEAKVLCLPSYAEGFPMAILDAWSYGLPVVATPVGGVPDVAVNGENMLLFIPGDVDMLAKQLDWVMSDEGLRVRLSKESLNMSRTSFNLTTITNMVGSIYESL